MAGNLPTEIFQAHQAAAVVVTMTAGSASPQSVSPQGAQSTPTGQTSGPGNRPLQGTPNGDAEPGPPDQSGSASNLEVVIPPTPAQHALCTAFLAGGDSQTSANGSQGLPAYHLLISTTGGTVMTTTAWCREYLHLDHSGPDKAGVDP